MRLRRKRLLLMKIYYFCDTMKVSISDNILRFEVIFAKTFMPNLIIMLTVHFLGHKQIIVLRFAWIVCVLNGYIVENYCFSLLF
jgi:hypothetical protein